MAYELLQLLCGHYVHCSTVAQHFGHAWSNFSCIITHADDRIRSHLLGVLNHDLVGIPARLLAKFGVERTANLLPSNIVRLSSSDALLSLFYETSFRELPI
jgi:hypothetical protein